MTARAYLWCLDHPRLRRPVLVVAAVQALAVLAVCAAPQAAAATNSMVLDWTGLRDTYGVPIGDYYLALASLPEQIAAGAPDVTWNPDTWTAWMYHALATVAANMAAVNILTGEAGLFVGVVAIALWLLKVTVSTYWLTVIGEIARAIAGAVIQVTTAAGLLLVAVPIGVFAGVVTVKRGEVGRGWTMIGVALTMPAASVAVFADPAGLMYGPRRAAGVRAPHRVLRRLGRHPQRRAGRVAGGGAGRHADRQPDHAHGARTVAAVELRACGGPGGWLRGGVVGGGEPRPARRPDRRDGRRAGTGRRWRSPSTSTAPTSGSGWCSWPRRACWALFMVASGWAVLKVSVKAVWTTVILLPTLWLGAIPGAPQRRAADVVWQFFRHGVEVLVYIVYVSVIGLAVQRIVAAPLPAELGGTNPFAHVLMMGGVAVVALLLLRHIRADLSGRPAGPGLVRQATGVAVGMGMTAAFGAAGSAAVAGARGLRRRSGSRGELTPWEQLEAESRNAAAVHGAPQPGFDPVPGGAGTAAAETRGGGAAAAGCRGRGG